MEAAQHGVGQVGAQGGVQGIPRLVAPAMAMPKEISEAVTKVMGAVGYLEKKGENKFHNYKFAAVGDLLAKVQPALVAAGLVIVQDETDHRLIADGAVMTATYQFTLAHTSGAEWANKPRHTGMANAKNTKGGFDDKALNKCHTAARKYFLLALFQIPTGDLPDVDNEEEAAPAGSPSPRRASVAEPRGEPAARPPSPLEAFLAGKDLTIPIPGAKAKRPEWSPWVSSFKRAIDACDTVQILDKLWMANAQGNAALSVDNLGLSADLEAHADTRRSELTPPAMAAE